MTLSSHSGPHGGNVYETARALGIAPDDLLDFSTACNAFAVPLTAGLVESTPYAFSTYPDATCQPLFSALAAHEAVPADQLILGNGSTDLIFRLLEALEPKSAVFVGPMFSEYAAACDALGISASLYPLAPENGFCLTVEDIAALSRIQTDLIVFCSPNNPGGSADPLLMAALGQLGSPRVLLDFTYKEFLWGESAYAAHAWQRVMEAARPGAQVVTLNSFTKFFGCPGIRLGYAVSSRQLAARVRKRQPAWQISAFAQTIGCSLLAGIDAYRDTLQPLERARTALLSELALTGLFDPALLLEGPSFLCLGLIPPLKAPAMREGLLRRHILVRVCDAIPGMPPGFVRIQVRAPQENACLLEAVRALW